MISFSSSLLMLSLLSTFSSSSSLFFTSTLALVYVFLLVLPTRGRISYHYKITGSFTTSFFICPRSPNGLNVCPFLHEITYINLTSCAPVFVVLQFSFLCTFERQLTPHSGDHTCCCSCLSVTWLAAFFAMQFSNFIVTELS